MRFIRWASVPTFGFALAFGGLAGADDPPPNLREHYEDTPGAHTERPGKHSTTAGRLGTSGEVGGGVDEQAGTEQLEGKDPDPVLERRQKEEDAAERAPE